MRKRRSGPVGPLNGAPVREGERGQVLVLFTLCLVALLGFAGLSLDGGSAYAQRRQQQTAADLAALGAANDYLISGDSTQATTRARTIAATNGFTHGLSGSVVDVALDTSNGIRVTVGVAGTHRNSIVGIMGMPTWQVSTTATALAGFPDHARAVSPFIFSVAAFGTDGTPKYQTPTDFGQGNGDVPNSDIDFAWTNYGTGNVDTGEVDDMIKGDLTIDRTLEFGDYIGQQNSGYHSFLFSDVNDYMSGQDWPAAIVDANGNFAG
jgi:Flp pilus assembly protein TadG